MSFELHRHQLPGESSDTFITALYTLSEHCDYGQMCEDLIRDHIVLGIRDADLSKKMQMVADLSLTKAIQMVRTHESVEREGQLQRSETDNSSIDQVNRNFHRALQTTQKPKQEKKPLDECYRCGEEPHSRRNCPASQAECRTCGATGHYAKMCRSRNYRQSYPKAQRWVKAVEVESEDEDSKGSFYISHIQKHQSIRRVEAEWVFKAKVGGELWSFEIDSGADETVAPPSFHNKQFKLYDTCSRLNGPDGHPLEVTGMQKLPITYRGTTLIQNIYFVRHQKTPLLGKPAIKAFKLLQRVNCVNKTELPEKRYSDRFQGFGNLEKPYTIVLESNAKPFAIKVSRKVPLPLLEKTEETLKKEVNLGIITKITEPTD